MRWIPSSAIPSQSGCVTGEVKDSIQWVNASSPVAAVNLAGSETVIHGSSMTKSASSLAWKMTAFVFVDCNVMTLLRPTSLPVPAVVGMAMKGGN